MQITKGFRPEKRWVSGNTGKCVRCRDSHRQAECEREAGNPTVTGRNSKLLLFTVYGWQSLLPPLALLATSTLPLDCLTPFFNQQRNENQCRHTVEPPPSKQSRCRQADNQHD